VTDGDGVQCRRHSATGVERGSKEAGGGSRGRASRREIDAHCCCKLLRFCCIRGAFSAHPWRFEARPGSDDGRWRGGRPGRRQPAAGLLDGGRVLWDHQGVARSTRGDGPGRRMEVDMSPSWAARSVLVGAALCLAGLALRLQSPRPSPPGRCTPVRIFPGSNLPLLCMSLDPVTNTLLVGDSAGFVTSWDLRTGDVRFEAQCHTEPVYGVGCVGEKEFVTCSWDGSIKLWSSGPSPRPLNTFKALDRSVVGLAALPPSRRIVYATSERGHSVVVLDCASGDARRLQIHDDMIRSLAFSRKDGLIGVASSDHTASVIDAVTLRRLATLGEHNHYVECIAFSPNHQVATGDAEGVVNIWDRASWRCAFCCGPHQGGVNSVAFSPDGAFLLVAYGDAFDRGLLAVWDASSGQLVKRVPCHRNPIVSVIVDERTNSVFTASKHVAIKEWRLDQLTGP
jgi:WD40 repeat protein